MLLLSCVVSKPIYGLLMGNWNRFLLAIIHSKGWVLERSSHLDLLKENSCKFAPCSAYIPKDRNCYVFHSWSPRAWVTWAIFNYLVKAEFKWSFCRWLQTGMFAKTLIRLNVTWTKITNEKQNYPLGYTGRWNIEAIGAFGANLQLFSFSGYNQLLRSSTQPWESIIERAKRFQ